MGSGMKAKPKKPQQNWKTDYIELGRLQERVLEHEGRLRQITKIMEKEIDPKMFKLEDNGGLYYVSRKNWNQIYKLAKP